MTPFATRLDAAIRSKGNPVTVGLDPRWDQLPPDVIARAKHQHAERPVIVASAFEEFCARVLDVVAPLAGVVKLQSAFFEEWGPAGCAVLSRVIRRGRDAGLI